MNAHLRAPRANSRSTEEVTGSSPVVTGLPRTWLWLIPVLAMAGITVAAMVGCSSGNQPAGPAAAYAKAKANFAKGANMGFDADIDALAKLASADPVNEYTTRARVLRLVVFSGEMQGYRTLADAYGKGADSAKEAAVKSEYTALRRDILQRGAELTLRLGEVAMQLTKGGALPKDLVVDLPYPNVDIPPSIAALDTARTGAKIAREDETQAELLATHAGVVDVLAAILHTDRAKAQSEMNAGPVQIDPVAFRLFLADQIMTGAAFYDAKHLYDPTHYKLLAGVAQDALQPLPAALKQMPDPDSAKRLKKIQDQIKSGLKSFPNVEI